ncbi:MAG: LD-carboxypeptidase [Candidatus Brocadiae bacterium]|nr:LD-carboxypeptidase [Candidatus Brocadiia bacterium]
MTIVKPRVLRRRDEVAIVAPSGAPPYDDDIQAGVSFLESLGLRVHIGESVKKSRGYIGRNRDLRARDLNRQFADRRIRAIFCLVGGFSAFEILELIDYPRIARNPKILMGFSDNTSLLNAIHRKTGLVTFMGENILWGLSEGRQASREFVTRALMEVRPAGIPPGAIAAWRDAPPRSGRTVAGNLWSTVWLRGTPWEPVWRDRIYFWEDVGENVDDLNSALWHLRLGGGFGRLRGMVVGHLEGIEEQKFGVTVKGVTLRATDVEKWPVIKVESFGHHIPSQVIPIGVKCRVGGGTVSLEESGVTG